MILTVTLNAAIDKRYVVEGFRVGEVNRVKECAYTPGGKGLNVSKPASIAGAEVVATGFVGGHAGRYIEDSLKPFGIRSEFYHLADESRSCINIWDEVNHVQTEFLEPGFTVSIVPSRILLSHACMSTVYCGLCCKFVSTFIDSLLLTSDSKLFKGTLSTQSISVSSLS